MGDRENSYAVWIDPSANSAFERASGTIKGKVATTTGVARDFHASAKRREPFPQAEQAKAPGPSFHGLKLRRIEASAVATYQNLDCLLPSPAHLMKACTWNVACVPGLKAT
jgi:hypothetical protein